jgi:ribosomal protein S18 acetylase RimI-like enzyme
MQYQVLEWDSRFFGVKVARITPSQLNTRQLSDILSELRGQQVKLAYWSSKSEFDDSVVTGLSGKLVDKKTTLAIDFDSLIDGEFGSTPIVEPFADSMSVADLEGLAIQAGAYSRFAVDPRMENGKFVALYTTWIAKSLQKELASDVLVIREDGQVVGMVTVGEKNGRGDIGLLAVDSRCRGRGYGEKLVRAAQKWFVADGYRYGQVVTQGQNVPAVNLYMKCGYSVERIEYFYHFWL